jgi:signal transduction histidine kinase
LAITASAVLFMVGNAVLLAVSFDAGNVVGVTVAAVGSAPALVMGWVVLRHVPGNAVGALLCLLGVLPNWMVFTDNYPAVLERRPGSLPMSDILIALQEGGWMWLYVPPGLLMLYFPTGRLLSRRWRAVAVGLVLVPVLFEVVAARLSDLYPVPFQHSRRVFGTASGADHQISMVLVFVLLGALLLLLGLSAASMVVRYRRSHERRERAQLTWFALVAPLLPGTLLLCWISYLVLNGADLVLVGLLATWVALPTATTIAVVRHDLYDVDRLASAAVTYTGVTAVLVSLYAVATATAGVFFGKESSSAAAAATAGCAIALSPLRRRLQRQVDRRLYPVRQRALTALVDLRAATDAGHARPEDLQDVLRRTLAEPALQVAYVLPGRQGLVDASGAPLSPPTGLSSSDGAGGRGTAVTSGGERIGLLLGAQRCGSALLQEIADAAALLVEVARLRIETTHALREVESSRRRMQQVGYRERLRLERDLHDGAQQRLVSLGMTLRVAQRHLDDPEANIDALLDQAVAELGTAVAELRQIAHGLRPSCLDDGLGPALQSMTRTAPVPIIIDVRAAELPDDVATTAYYIATEAITNAVKHAHAQQIAVWISHHAGQLVVRVDDDGRGGADATGNGLSGLADRVAAAGGTLSLRSPLRAGTVIEATLPCAS